MIKIIILFIMIINVLNLKEIQPSHEYEGFKEINIESFELIKNNQTKNNYLIYFYVNWCDKCKLMSLELIKIGKALINSKNDNLILTKLNCELYRSFCKKLKIKGIIIYLIFKKDFQKLNILKKIKMN
jgi:thioredoxin-like negative regulator of GroEL